jgi:hypothetical protein
VPRLYPARRDARVAGASFHPQCNACRPTTVARDSRSGETLWSNDGCLHPVANAIHRRAQATSGTGAARRPAAQAKRRVLDVVEHVGSGFVEHGRFCGSSSTPVLRFWVRCRRRARRFWVRVSTPVPGLLVMVAMVTDTRLPRGNSSTFLWTTCLDRDRSVEDRSAACQPDSRERRIVVALHRGRSHWCSSPRPGDHAVAVTGALHRDWW